MVVPIFSYTRTGAEHSPPWRKFFPGGRRLPRAGPGALHQGATLFGPAARAQMQQWSRLRGNRMGRVASARQSQAPGAGPRSTVAVPTALRASVPSTGGTCGDAIVAASPRISSPSDGWFGVANGQSHAGCGASAPGLNPVAWARQHPKRVGLRDVTCPDPEEPHLQPHPAIGRLRQIPDLVRSFLAGAGLPY
jgi:hypothetical protein